MKPKNDKFEKIIGIRKVKYCKSCNKKIEVKNIHQELCYDCGYRPHNVRRAKELEKLELEKLNKEENRLVDEIIEEDLRVK